MEEVQPGQVWWCDGVALSFEAHFKRRPVLVLAVRDDVLTVAPLSSRRRYGQEEAVTHQGGVSYFTGTVADVPLSALLKPLGAWSDFPLWQARKEEAARRAARTVARWDRFLRLLRLRRAP